jgi:CubicO group peptidase (beta-lactamase class C family)
LLAQGIADERTGRLVTADDPVRVASISKLIVALGVDKLVQSGKLDLRRDVSEYLGWTLRNPAFPDVPITLEMLLSHRSSLTDGGEYIIPLGTSLQSFVANPKSWDAANRPGSHFRYTNLNYPVIATVMERATGERFDRLMQRLVFRPLRLDACFNWSGCSITKVQRAVVLRRENGEVRRDDLQGRPPECLVYVQEGAPCDLATYVIGTNGGLFSPQGGVRISMRDLARIGQYLHTRRKKLLQGAATVSPELLTGETEKGFFCRFALGVQAIGAAKNSACRDDLFGDGRPRIGHAGEAYGLRSGLWLDPSTGKGVAFFTTAVPDDAPSGASAFTQREDDVVR